MKWNDDDDYEKKEGIIVIIWIHPDAIPLFVFDSRKKNIFTDDWPAPMKAGRGGGAEQPLFISPGKCLEWPCAASASASVP